MWSLALALVNILSVDVVEAEASKDTAEVARWRQARVDSRRRLVVVVSWEPRIGRVGIGVLDGWCGHRR